jgi:type II secretory pathway pseudopilin PulG
MKITKREITLIAVVALIAIVALSIVYLILPQINKRPAIKEDYETVRMQKDQSDAQINNIPTRIQEGEELKQQQEVYESRFFPETESPDIHIAKLFPKEQAANLALQELLIEKDESQAEYETQKEPAPDGAPIETGENAETWVSKPAQPVVLSTAAVTIKLSGSLEETACKFAEQIEAEKDAIAAQNGLKDQIVIEIESVTVLKSDDENSTDYEVEYRLNFISAK